MNNFLKTIAISLISLNINAQTIDKIEALIGEEIVLSSDIESQYLQYTLQANQKSLQSKCEIIEDILFQKLLIHKAKIDSVEVTNEEVESEINTRLNYFENQLGSIEKVEEYFGKNKMEIELELSKVIKDQFFAQKIQSTIASDVKITPSEVKNFFELQKKADLPQVPTKIEIKQIVIKPVISDEQKKKSKERLNSFRKRVYNGEDFKMLATLYSDDTESAKNGGELGFVNRGELVPSFERAAFRLKEGEISEVVESRYGFHLIQLIKRRGNQINVRHILLKNKVTSTALFNAKTKIDNIKQEIISGKLTFENALIKYSDDDSKNNGGYILNNNMSTMHILDDIDPSLKYSVDKLNVNQISEPIIMQFPDQSSAYRLLKINKKIESHTANIIDDFTMISDVVLNVKKQEELLKWIQSTIDKTYIKISDELKECEFKNKWIK